MTISVAIRIKGQAAGLPYQATAGEAITATLDSVAGVNSVQWSVAAGDDLVAPGAYTLVTSGVKGENVAFNASATVGTALLLQAVVNADPTLYARAKVWVPAANGLETGADGEGYEGDATHGTTGIQNAAIRASGVGTAVPIARTLTATTPIRIDGGASADLSADRTLSILAASGAVAGSMSAAHYTLVNAATATPTAATLAKWGASVDLGAAYFYTAGTVATSGLFRTANNQIGAAARNAANGANLSVWKYTSADRLELGDSANGAGVRVQALGSGANAVVLAMGGASADAVTVGLKGVGLFGALSGATAGDGVLTWNAATTAPTGAPTGTAVDTWVSAASGLQARTGKVLTVTLVPVTTSAATDQRLDKIHASVHTSDASVTQIAAYTLPAASCWVARFFVTGQKTGTDACAVYSFEVTGVRAAGSATVTTGTVTTLVDTIGAVPVPSAAASTNDVLLRVQGVAATEIDWCLSAVHVHLYAV